MARTRRVNLAIILSALAISPSSTRPKAMAPSTDIRHRMSPSATLLVLRDRRREAAGETQPSPTSSLEAGDSCLDELHRGEQRLGSSLDLLRFAENGHQGAGGIDRDLTRHVDNCPDRSVERVELLLWESAQYCADRSIDHADPPLGVQGSMPQGPAQPKAVGDIQAANITRPSQLDCRRGSSAMKAWRSRYTRVPEGLAFR